MKKCLVIALLVALCLALAACGSDENENLDKRLIGSWYSRYDGSLRFVFKKDGTMYFYETANSERVKGSWSTSDGVIRLDYGPYYDRHPNYVETERYTVNGDALTIGHGDEPDYFRK